MDMHDHYRTVGNHRISFTVLVAAFLAIAVRVSAGELPKAEPGQPAPSLESLELMQAPSGTKLDAVSLRGEVVVLEFWFTTCGPCIQWQPHMNKLEERFRDKNVHFIAVTSEDGPTVSKFLEDHTIQAWIGLDKDRRVHDAFGIRSFPTAALIAPDGMFAGWTSPSMLVKHPDMLLDLLAGKEVERLSSTPVKSGPDESDLIRDEEIAGLVGEGADAPRPLTLFMVRPASGDPPPQLTLNTNHLFRLDGVTLREALADVYDLPVPLVVGGDAHNSEKEYDIFYRWGGDSRKTRPFLRQALADTFELNVRYAKREMDVLVLNYEGRGQPDWPPAQPMVKYDAETGNTAPTPELLERENQGETFFVAMGGTDNLAHNLTELFGKPVVDDVGAGGYYLFWFPWDFENNEAGEVIPLLRDKYGLSLTHARREIDVLLAEETINVIKATGE